MTDLTDLFLDFESHYDSRDYSLARMPTQAYIRDPRWRVLGCAVAVGDGEPVYVQPDALEAFFAALPWHSIRAIAHNAGFDLAVLADRYGHVPAAIGCTQALARYAIVEGQISHTCRASLHTLAALVGAVKGDTAASVAAGGQVLADYALTDVRICRALWRRYAPTCPPQELALIDAHVRLGVTRPLMLDRAALAVLAHADPDPHGELLRSPRMFARALRACGVDPPRKANKSGGYAFAKSDAFMLELESHEDPRVQVLHRLRTEGTSNIVRTRAQRLLSCVPETYAGPLRAASFGAPLDYYGAHTGRSAGRGMLNMQNLPARRPQQMALRRAIRPPDSCVLVVADSAQVEARVLAWLAGNLPVLEAFRAGRDVYKEFGAALYGCESSDVTARQRQVAKAAVLALGFGQGPVGFAAYCARSSIALGDGEAERTVAVYRHENPPVRALWRRCLDSALSGRQRLPSGRSLTYPNVRRADGNYTFERPACFTRTGRVEVANLWHGVAAENLVQGTARDVVLYQTLAAAALAPWARLALLVHDEAVFVVPRDRAKEMQEVLEREFTRPPSWAQNLPLAGEVSAVETYADA